MGIYLIFPSPSPKNKDPLEEQQHVILFKLGFYLLSVNSEKLEAK